MTKNSANQMWGGRFNEKPSDIMERINESISFDNRMWAQDITGSKAHCEMLVKQEIISKEDGDAILKGLDQIAGEIESGDFEFKTALEDIHMNIESRLRELIGDAGGRLHTGRSRNDQCATDIRLWIRDAIDDIINKIEAMQQVLNGLCDEHKTAVMPGFTHLQPAQPVTLARHLEAYHDMLARDKERFIDCRKRVNQSPLGAAAMAGTPYPIDRDFTAQKLGFDRPIRNTMDAVAAKDFANEFLFVCAQTGLHLSRLAEEIIIWATPQFGYITLSDQWSTGSSIMPQKKNPDAAELVRGKTGRLNGNLLQLMTVMKGLPLTYNKDMQEDKEPVFDAADALALAIAAMTGMVSDMAPVEDNLRKAAGAGFATATDLADWCVRELNMPFRDAHHVTGALVKMAEDKGCDLHELSLEEMQSVEPQIQSEVVLALTVDNSVGSRASYGGTSPIRVREQIERWRERLG